MENCNVGLEHYLSAEAKLRSEFAGFKEDIDDLVQEGLIGFFEATKKINPNKGSFFTYCYVRARWRVLDHLRRMKHHKLREFSNQELFNLDNKVEPGNGMALTAAVRVLNKLSNYHKSIVFECLFSNNVVGTPQTTIRRVSRNLYKQMTELIN